MEPDQKKDRRRSVRHMLSRKTFVISPQGVGYLLDISMGGFAAQYYYSKFSPMLKWSANISVVDGTLTKNLPVSIAWIENSEDYPFCLEPNQVIGFSFGKLNDFQKMDVRLLITCYAKEEASAKAM